jgi:hypothetical protein
VLLPELISLGVSLDQITCLNLIYRLSIAVYLDYLGKAPQGRASEPTHVVKAVFRRLVLPSSRHVSTDICILLLPHLVTICPTYPLAYLHVGIYLHTYIPTYLPA